jgi:hypothetical protein
MNDPQVSLVFLLFAHLETMRVGIIPKGGWLFSCRLSVSLSACSVGQRVAMFGYLERFYLLDGLAELGKPSDHREPNSLV